jgi:transposase-like protein
MKHQERCLASRFATKGEFSHPLLRVPGDGKRIIYTTHACESLHSACAKAVRARIPSFPSDDAVTKFI